MTDAGAFPDHRFQRVGSISNTHAGRDFQDAVEQFLGNRGLVLEREFAIAVGHAVKKLHRFDLGSATPPVLVECKSYTWTASGNSPSAKIRGLNEAMRNLIARLVFHARTADLADDVAARHFVVTVLTEELIVEHDGAIPPELEEAFTYLSEQNVVLARAAARGVMSAFADSSEPVRSMPLVDADDRLALPAA